VRSQALKSWFAPLAALSLWACATVPAGAATPNASMGGMNGIKAGEARIHPYFELELHYDSTAIAQPASLDPEYLFHFRPGVKMELPTRLMEASLDANLDYLWYTGLLSPGSQVLSRLEARSALMAAFNKEGAVEVQVKDTFARSDRTGNAAYGVGILSLFNQLALGLPIHPGGQALEFKPELSWATEFFDPFISCTGDASCDPELIHGTNYNQFGLLVDGRYKFLPKTALIGRIDFSMRRSKDRVANPDVYLLKLETGLAGLVTPRIAVLLKLGWGQGLATVTSGTLTGQVEASYLLNETSSLKGGYLRLIEPVSAFGLYRNDRLYAEARFLLGGKLTLHSGLAVDFIEFYGGADRNDRLVSLTLGPEYQFTRWFYGSFGYTLTARVSDVVTSTSLNFARHEASLQATFTY
jgi:hypothetical protein